MPFAILILRPFMAAIIDGASPIQVYFRLVLPLLSPAIVTVIVVAAVGIYNDFSGPLYVLPAAQNVTVQLTLYGMTSGPSKAKKRAA